MTTSGHCSRSAGPNPPQERAPPLTTGKGGPFRYIPEWARNCSGLLGASSRRLSGTPSTIAAQQPTGCPERASVFSVHSDSIDLLSSLLLYDEGCFGKGWIQHTRELGAPPAAVRAVRDAPDRRWAALAAAAGGRWGCGSEEGAGGPGAALSARGPSWREKLTAPEAQFRRESPRRESALAPAPSFNESGAGKPREEKRTALSKVVLRRLPPGLTKEQLEEQLRPLPAHDYFEVVAADLSLYPHLYSRAYINFRNPDDILLFRDRFDGYIFIGNKGLEYPAVVEFAPFQKIAKKKLKKKDTKTGSIEETPEYKQFLETYSLEEEKAGASPETLLGEIEVKTRELLARRTTPLLEYIKTRKLEKQRIREEKREERRRRELEKKRFREEEKRKRREEERWRRKEADKQKRTEKEVKIKLLKKLETGEEAATEKHKERSDSVGPGDEKQEARPVESLPEMPGERF
ncbi:LOW QUALITY PROTEIN: regulator of nonsense transcripts 3A [Arvicola amphibius]|uniref:LOW QUALITY PROTEIN: regulator of nonsense transcripts 3A n=1 Tax=Arvicola amphibius TaxID=1047088 RepID=UPI001C086C03|nr:LOW QUALITY PROTEIN: regulator of nonsense transcripts 3A [Arvicola amphibius]